MGGSSGMMFEDAFTSSGRVQCRDNHTSPTEHPPRPITQMRLKDERRGRDCSDVPWERVDYCSNHV